MNWRRLEQESQQRFGSFLFVGLIAVTSFLIGRQYRPTSAPSANEAAAPSQSSTLRTLEQALQQPSTATETTAPSPATIEEKISINTATADELDLLPGIGPSYAKAIIDYRTKNGPFVRLEDIQQVKGIGPKTFEKLKDRITL